MINPLKQIITMEKEQAKIIFTAGTEYGAELYGSTHGQIGLKTHNPNFEQFWLKLTSSQKVQSPLSKEELKTKLEWIYNEYINCVNDSDEIVDKISECIDMVEELPLIAEGGEKWISVKEKKLSHLKEGDSILTLDEVGNMIPYKFFLGGLNIIGDHKDDNRLITHWMPLPQSPKDINQ